MPTRRKEDIMEKKKWKHDCKACVHVTSVKTARGWRDLYVCEDTYVLRYGNKGEDYQSHPELAHIMMCMYKV